MSHNKTSGHRGWKRHYSPWGFLASPRLAWAIRPIQTMPPQTATERRPQYTRSSEEWYCWHFEGPTCLGQARTWTKREGPSACLGQAHTRSERKCNMYSQISTPNNGDPKVEGRHKGTKNKDLELPTSASRPSLLFSAYRAQPQTNVQTGTAHPTKTKQRLMTP